MLRFLGYANELGEAFRPLAPAFVRPSYGVASIYVLADTYDKAVRADERAGMQLLDRDRRLAHIFCEVASLCVWPIHRRDMTHSLTHVLHSPAHVALTHPTRACHTPNPCDTIHSPQ